MSQPRILVVDDNPAVGKFIASVLQPLGYRVRLCKDGAEALKVLASNPPQLAFIDLIMPRINGYQLLKIVEQKKLATGTVFILMTSARESTVSKVMQSTQLKESLAKPLRAPVIQETVNKYLPPTAPSPSPDAGADLDLQLETPGDSAEPTSLEISGAFSAEVTSDDQIKSRSDLVSLVRDRLDSAVAQALSEKLQDILSCKDGQQLLETMAAVLASAINDRLVDELLELVKKHQKLM